jgi:hypothetical protein
LPSPFVTCLAGLVFSATCMCPRWAHADAATDKAAAEALFQEARTLLDQGKYAEACKQLEASNRLDAGLGTLLYLADCYEKAGRTASAWATFREAASLARGRGDESRATVANDRADALEPKLSKLWLTVADDNPPGLVVERDGSEIPKASWGVALPVDPGTHTFRARAPGKEEWTVSVDIEGDAQTAKIEVPVLTDAPEPSQASTEARAATTSAAPPGADTGASDGSGQRMAGYVVGGVGVVGLVLGSVFGIRAISQNDDSLTACAPDDPTRCTPHGKDLRDSAQTSATISTIAFGVGGAALAAGVVLVLTAPSSSDEARLELRSRVTPAGGQLSLGGHW